MRVQAHLSTMAVLCAAAAVALLAPAGATAATVVNGDFETGTLAGWQVVNAPPFPEESGNWFAYTGTAAPIPGGPEPVPAPPAGKYGAITDQGGPGTHILYQDVALEPYYKHQLSMLVYYVSSAALVTPSPNTLSAENPPMNQQYRVDVIRPTAPLESVSPSDILGTVFATSTAGPLELKPTLVTADLSPFAGQTVRLRLAEVDNQLYFNAAADSISIQSTPPSNAIVVGRAILNKKKGTAKLPVTVPGGGVLSAVDARFVPGAIVKKGVKRLVKTATLTTTAPGTVNVPLKPTKAAWKILKAKGKVKIKVALTFTPTGGAAATTTVKATLKLKKR